LDKRRLAVFAGFGAFWTGVVNSYWLPYLNTLIPGTQHKHTAAKVLVQQLLWNPTCFMPAFYGASLALAACVLTRNNSRVRARIQLGGRGHAGKGAQGIRAFAGGLLADLVSSLGASLARHHVD